MINPEAFNTTEFPKWEGYNTTPKKIQAIKDLWLNDKDFMAKTIHEQIKQIHYLTEIIFYIQTKINKGEELNLGLDSSKEVFDIMIMPCEVLYEECEELTLEDYIELEDNEVMWINQDWICPECESILELIDNKYFKCTNQKCYYQRGIDERS